MDLSHLTVSDREVVTGILAQKTQAEVATHLGLTEGRVRHRVFTALKVLQTQGENTQHLEDLVKKLCTP